MSQRCIRFHCTICANNLCIAFIRCMITYKTKDDAFISPLRSSIGESLRIAKQDAPQRSGLSYSDFKKDLVARNSSRNVNEIDPSTMKQSGITDILQNRFVDQCGQDEFFVPTVCYVFHAWKKSPTLTTVRRICVGTDKLVGSSYCRSTLDHNLLILLN